MINLFNVIPKEFFNCLASVSNNRVYADCIEVIYKEYDREISYRIRKDRIRDSIAIYLLENHIQFEDLGFDEDNQRSGIELANTILRRLCSKEVGWLEEEIDDVTFEKYILMTEQGVMLAEFLSKLKKPERDEFSSYIYNIYNILNNEEQWNENPYIDGLKSIYKNAKDLSKALKKLATFIKKIIERMIREETLESLTENIIEYCNGDFIREYSRLIKHQNIHMYRNFIRSRLDDIHRNEELFSLLVIDCAIEEDLDEGESKEYISDVIRATKEFLSEDYDRIIRDIKHKINIYLEVSIGRARFLRNNEEDAKGYVDQTVRYIIEELDMIGGKDDMPDYINDLFLLDKNEFIDTESIRYPRKAHIISQGTEDELEQMTEEDIIRAKKALEREIYNPYSREKMKVYIANTLGNKKSIEYNEFPMEGKRDVLCAISAVAYAKDNGYDVEILDGYVEKNKMALRKVRITRGDK